MSEVPTNAKAVREDDAFDVEAVHTWLTRQVPDLADFAVPPTVRQFVGGASNLTYLLSYPGRDLILRRPPAGTKAGSAHDMAREFRVQQQVAGQFPLVPHVVALCQDESVLGADFYVMDRIAGTILRANLTGSQHLSPDQARALCEAMIDVLVRLHSVDVEAAGLAALGKGPGYVKRQVTGWSERYRAARTWNVPRGEKVMRWLAERMPEDVGYCLIHNDFRLDNLVLDDADLTRPVGVLDWEMATLGDPLMDLGGSLAYWVEAGDGALMRRIRRQPSNLPGMLTRRQMLEAYASRTGLQASDFTFYEVFGLFRLAVIIQQIYYRYHHKQSTNPAFRNYWLMCGYLIRRCHKIMREAG
ncbi:phosphotransferase family protein [Spongisporangium articulatum]|uniref:Phosphotransferase family protein n=1 Tax=Spongisporangium articulatum TaxID=3362603 RepID=A0ABW8AH60_9ACTN